MISSLCKSPVSCFSVGSISSFMCAFNLSLVPCRCLSLCLKRQSGDTDNQDGVPFLEEVSGQGTRRHSHGTRRIGQGEEVINSV